MTEEDRPNVITLGRRAFLKTSGLAAMAGAFGHEAFADAAGAGSGAAADAPQAESAGAASPANPVDLVNLLQGTNSTKEFSRGNTLPIAAMPFGMGHWTLESHADTPWMFQPAARRIQGFRCTHQLSPWLDDYGYATFLPFRGEVHPAAAARASSYDVETARLTPHSLQLLLLRYRAQFELAPTERCAILTAGFEPAQSEQSPGAILGEPAGWIFDISGDAGSIQPDPDKRTVRFTSPKNSGGVPDNFATYYVLTFPDAWQSFEIQRIAGHQVGIVRFAPVPPQEPQTLEARIGTSFISFEQAERNLEAEIGSRSLASVRDAAATRWNELLGKIEIEGASLDQQRVFYSCMYRAFLFPRIWHEPEAGGAMHHFSAYNGKVEPGLMYADHGYWDVYRAWYPLMSILMPERLAEILQAWVNAYKEGGWLPQFPAPGYRACMTGSLIDSLFGDAAAKGIPGFDLATAYEGLKKHATTPGDPAKGYGRVGIEYYLKLHYVPADRIPQSVAETVDAAYGDFCIAQVANALGKHEDYTLFLKRSQNWRNVFDPQVKFFRGKNEDGGWLPDFDPITWGSPYVEGSAWQHRWDAPQDISGMVQAMGGEVAAAAALDGMLRQQPLFRVGVYGFEIHEMSEMAAVGFGQYAQSNQPVHHLLYLFPHAGRPDLAQLWVRAVLRTLYTPENFPGDEDTGSMAAWYILSSMGFYPACPGRPEYTLGSPLFPRATLHLPGGKSLVIEAPANSPDSVFVNSVQFNGQPYPNLVVQHAALVQGGTLEFSMASSDKSHTARASL